MAAATEFGIVDAHVPHFVGAVLQEFQVIPKRHISESFLPDQHLGADRRTG